MRWCVVVVCIVYFPQTLKLLISDSVPDFVWAKMAHVFLVDYKGDVVFMYVYRKRLIENSFWKSKKQKRI